MSSVSTGALDSTAHAGWNEPFLQELRARGPRGGRVLGAGQAGAAVDAGARVPGGETAEERAMMELVLTEGTPEEQAATRMQAMQRGNMVRRGQLAAGATARPTVEEEAAATRMQAMQRGNAARRGRPDGRPAAQGLVTPHEVAAATRVQAMQRGNTARKSR